MRNSQAVDGRSVVGVLFERLGRSQRIVEAAPSWCVFDWREPGGGGPIGVLLEATAALEEIWLVAGVYVCEAHEIAPTLALARNARSTIGALAFHDGQCVLRQALPLSQLAGLGGARLLDALAAAARAMRRELASRENEQPVFEPYAA